MQCSCGGEASEHSVQRNLKIVAEFAECRACGRVSWLWGKDEMIRIDTEKAKKRSMK